MCYLTKVILHRSPRLVTKYWLYRTSRNFVVKRRHKNVNMTSALIKMADINVRYFKVKMDFIKCWYQKLCTKKNPTYVCEKDRQFCPSGNCLASLGKVVMPSSYPRDRIVYSILKLMIDSYKLILAICFLIFGG